MSGPLGFLASNTYLAARNPKFRTELKPNAAKIYLFWSSLEFGGEIQKFRAEIELVCDEDLFFGLHLNLGTKFSY